MKIRLLCTNGTRGSTSLKALASSLSAKLGYKVLRSTRPKDGRNNVRYGQSVDKLTQYRWFKERGLSTLEFTTSSDEAQQWITEGHSVFGRTLLNSSCGKGIEVFYPAGENPEDDGDMENEDIVFSCPVYTKYKKKKREFRVHVFKDTVVAVTEKKRRSGYEGHRDTKIRNLANGYVFCQTVVNEPPGLRDLALAAAKVTQSHFKGVDMGYNEQKDELFVIEVNSAPGIAGSNVEAYANAILSESIK